MTTNPRLCVALDAPGLDEAARMIAPLEGSVEVFKVGLELFCSAGPDALGLVLDRGKQVFLDLKVNDIPNQAAGAVTAAGRAGVHFLTVHGNAGRATLRAAVDARGERGPKLLVVSVLTSLDSPELAEVGVTRSVAEQVDAMAELATEEGADGLVLSAREVSRVRPAHPGLILVTPGIRPASSEISDQRRVATPGAAAAAGADMLVVGRPITAAADPAAAAQEILDEIGRASSVVSR